MPSAHVLSIQALAELKAAFTRFGHEAQEALNATDIELRRTLDWLQERLAYWRNEVRRREQILAQAERALAACRAARYYNPKTGAYIEPSVMYGDWRQVYTDDKRVRAAVQRTVKELATGSGALSLSLATLIRAYAARQKTVPFTPPCSRLAGDGEIGSLTSDLLST